MWGAEMGVNDRGVVIGNEAVFTREPYKSTDALTGMDLLRLGLERSDTARQALDTIIDLLSTHGQGGACGYEDKKMLYHNSFLIADPQDAWVLETAGDYWGARQLNEAYAISNGLTLENDFTMTHPNLESHARKKGWKKQPFSFRDAYSDRLYTYFSACKARRASNNAGLKEDRDLLDAFARLRDHGPRESNPLKGLRGTSVCSHGANDITRHAGQTTGSLVVKLTGEAEPEIWVTATAAPCTALFRPLYMGINPPGIGRPTGRFDPESLWWRHERLHRQVMGDYKNRIALYRRERDEKETEMVNQWSRTPREEETAREELCLNLWETADEAENEWIRRIDGAPRGKHTRFWIRQNRKAGLVF
jgi:dipeptidase